MSKVIDIHNLQKTYNADSKNPTTALRGIDISVNKGDFVAIMGRSGSGKSSLMHIIGLLDQHFEGDFLLNGSPSENSTKASYPTYEVRRSGLSSNSSIF
jgi:ABC-type lipoprotein export system ATPase subunit